MRNVILFIVCCAFLAGCTTRADKGKNNDNDSPVLTSSRSAFVRLILKSSNFNCRSTSALDSL